MHIEPTKTDNDVKKLPENAGWNLVSGNRFLCCDDYFCECGHIFRSGVAYVERDKEDNHNYMNLNKDVGGKNVFLKYKY